jgi:trehalose synthase
MDIWHVNTTMHGGGVAEILVALKRGDAATMCHRRFVTNNNDPAVFNITKRIHHRVHGVNRGPLPNEDEHAALLAFAQDNADRLRALIAPGDVVVLHDPQTVAMIPSLIADGIPVAWRCHIGTMAANQTSISTWDYLSQFWRPGLILVFSVPEFVPQHAAGYQVLTIAPSIDPGAPKNRPLSVADVQEVLCGIGLSASGAGAGVPARAPSASVISESTIGAEPVLLQVSRWDPLKDMAGVLRAFVESSLPARAHLVLCGPSPLGVADDPEAEEVFKAVVAYRDALPSTIRRRVHLVCPDLADIAGNARLVGALQTRADVVIQKSLQEGFGLTVTEAMWKGRAVIAGRVGGIATQIVSDESGLLLDDPTDLAGLATATLRLLDDPGRRAALGRAAHERVQERFTVTREIADHHRLYQLLGASPG